MEEEVVKWSGATNIPNNPQLAAEQERAAEKAGSTPAAIINTNNDEQFEAPIVKSASSEARKNNQPIKKNNNKDELSVAIKENTAHLNKDDKKESVNILKEIEQQKQMTPPKSQEPMHSLKSDGKTKSTKIKDKIDKEILSAILKNVVTPQTKISDTTPDKLGEKSKSEDNDEHNIYNKAKNKNESQIKSFDPDSKNIDKLAKDSIESKIKKGESKENIKNESPSHREKIITPDNFKDVKTIHPNELVKIVSGKTETAEDLEEGETIKFE